MTVPLSQPQRIDRKHFRALFRTPTTLQPSPPILLTYVVASNTTFPFEKLFHGSYFLPALATLLQTLCCKIRVKIFS